MSNKTESPGDKFQSITASIMTRFSQIGTEEQQRLRYSFSQYTSGLDPNSSLIIDYLNSSYSKYGWASIDQEIGGFLDIINDPSRSIHERVDAEGYYAICKFKIAGYLHGLVPEERETEMARLAPVFKDHFNLSGDINFEQILEHTGKYAREIMAKQQGQFQTAAEAGRLCQVSAVIMQMPRIGGECFDFDAVAITHFNAATLCANMGSSRGCTYLSTAYEWLRNPNIPYKDAVKHLVDTRGQDFDEFCQTKEYEYTKKSAELGSVSAIGALGKQAKKMSEFEDAEEKLKIAADGGLNRYQYLLGELYLEQDRNSEADHYFKLAAKNGFDVDKALLEKGVSRPIMVNKYDTISSILKKEAVKEDLSNLDQVDISSASDSTKKSWAKFVEQEKSKKQDQGYHK